VVAWGTISSKYIQSAVQNVQEYLKNNGDMKLKKKALYPFETTYRAEIDVGPRDGKLLPVPDWDLMNTI
jgi:hypothetical protein